MASISGYTTDMYNTLCSAIATGARSVYYGDKRVEYRSLEDMMTVKRAMELELGLRSKRRAVRFATFNKGIQLKQGNQFTQGNNPDFDNDDSSMNAWT